MDALKLTAVDAESHGGTDILQKLTEVPQMHEKLTEVDLKFLGCMES